MTVSAARKLPVVEIELDKVLDGIEMSMDQFIDMCILCGCDYTDNIRGMASLFAALLACYRLNGFCG